MARIKDLGINVIPGVTRLGERDAQEHAGAGITPVVMGGDSGLIACGENTAAEERRECGRTREDDECDIPCTHTESCGECTHTAEEGCEIGCTHTEEDDECERNCSHTEDDDECDQTCSHTEGGGGGPGKKKKALGEDAIAQLTQQLESHLSQELEN